MARHAEVEHLHVAVGPDHDVFRLDVPMDDAGGVRRDERVRHLPDGVHNRRQRRPGIHKLAQHPPVDQLLDDVIAAVVGLSDVVDGDDVGVVEGGGGPGLPEEPLDVGGRGGAVGAHDLDGDPAVQPGVKGPVNVPHPAVAEAVFKLIVAQCRRCHGEAGGLYIIPSAHG